MMIPTLSSQFIHQIDIDNLMDIGFCYVKLPDAILTEKIRTCIQVARTFFQSTPEEKAKWHVKEILNPGERYQGYIVRSQSQNTNVVEQFFFEPDAPYGPYEIYTPFIQEMNAFFRNSIFLPIFHAIFQRLQLPQDDFVEATANPYCSLVFQCYPCIAKDRNIIRLNAHKDFGLITVLFFEESGLEVKYKNEWHAIPPREGYVIVNLGNAIELMTAKRCCSALHRVTNATDNRISMVYFLNPNHQQKVRNYVDNTLISPNGEIFFKQQFAEYYEVDY